MQTKEQVEQEFLTELYALLRKWAATLEADDHACTESRQDIRMTVTVPTIYAADEVSVEREFTEINLGNYVMPNAGGAASSGIYCIQNTINGKRYIGQSVNVEHRKGQHFDKLRRNKHRNAHLQASFNKHGEAVFAWIVLETVAVGRLDIRESAWVSRYNTASNDHGYNLRGGTSLHSHSDSTRRKLADIRRGKTMSLDSRRKLSAASHNRSLEHRRKLSEANRTRKWTDAAKQKLSVAHKGKRLSAEHRAKMAESARHRQVKKED